MEKKALLSERMRNIASQTGSPEAYALIQRMAAQAEELEAERTKLLDLLQQGVDAAMDARIVQGNTFLIDNFLAACKDVGIEPSQD